MGRRSKRAKDKQTKKRVCLVKSEICDAYAPSHEPVKNLENPSNSRRFKWGGRIRVNIILRATHLMSLRGIAKSGSPRDTVYSRGKGVCKHKTTDCRLRQSVGQKRSIRRISRKGYHITIKCCLGRSFALNRNKFSTLKTAYFQRIYFLFFLFKISKCINA